MGRKLFQPAYTQARLKELAVAIAKWYAGLPKPRVANAKAIAGVSKRTILMYLKAAERGRGPQPLVMSRLLAATGNKVFLLQEQEKAIFRDRGFVMPDEPSSPEDCSGLEAFGGRFAQEQPGFASPEADDHLEESANAVVESAFSRKASKLLVGVLTSVSVISDLLQEAGLAMAPKSIRHKAAEAVSKIVTTFSLTKDDFKKRAPEGGDDAETRMRMERVYGLFQ